MKHRCTILLMFLLPLYSISQQDSSFRLIRTLKGDIREFTTDNLDNVYVLTSRNQVIKYNAAGDSVAVYSDVKKYGRPSLIDVSNPLRLLIYYSDFSTVVMLDRFLNMVHVTDLRKKGIWQARAIGQSYDNNIWVFDEAEARLKKMDGQGTLLMETPDTRLLLSRSIAPVKVFDENKYVYLYDSLQGIFVFDYFGAFKNGILVQGWQHLKVSGNFIFGSRADTLYRYEISTFLTDEWPMPDPVKNSKSFSFSAARFYALKQEPGTTTESLYIYKLW